MKRIEAMRKGGKKLGKITAELYDSVQVGASPHDIEQKAQKLIKGAGGIPSFQTVRDYKWATCISINDGVVHGIPSSKKPFKDGDMVMVDVGLLWEGYHTDNAFTRIAGKTTKSKTKFLNAGKEALDQAIKVVKPGVHIGVISLAMQTAIEKHGFTPAIGLTGHGISKRIHEDPMIPCLLRQPIEKTPKLRTGQTIALEVIYMEGSSELQIEDDGWTISTKDGKLSAVFEETIEVLSDGYSILTKPALFQRF